MSIHPSLSAKAKTRRHRSVLKRYERIELLKKGEKWSEEDSIFGLPKVKILKLKLKKEKAAPPPEEAAAVAEGAAVPEEGAPPKEEAAEEKKKEGAEGKAKKEK